MYVAPKPLIGGFSNSLPPAPALWAAARLLPAFRRRTRAARSALATRPWLAEAHRWYGTERVAWHEANSAIQAEDPRGLDSRDLVAHIHRVRAHAAAGYRRHFSLHGPDLLPTGLLLARCADWGIDPGAVLPALAGSSPASLGHDIALDALRRAVATSCSQPSTFQELRDAFTAPGDARRDLDGDGIGRVTCRGRACVAADPADALGRLRPGDVLVAWGTTPSYNMALGLAGAVVVEEGGLLCHAAVIARELGIPAVIGAAGAMRSIPDGSIIEVDPLEGRVRVLAPTS